MIVVVTMAGLGRRFREAGYDCPKYMIEAKNKTLFEWSMDSLIDYNPHTNKYIFVVRKEDKAEKFIREKCKGYGIPNIEVMEIGYLTDGQATTAMCAIEECTDGDEAVLIYNIDTYVEPYVMKYEDLYGDGHIPCFKASGEHWSFVKADVERKVIEVREKERISDNCSVGAYYFSSVNLYRSTYKEFYVHHAESSKTEKYIAPMYNFMIERGYEVTMSLLDADNVHVLGTPEELQIFMEK